MKAERFPILQTAIFCLLTAFSQVGTSAASVEVIIQNFAFNPTEVRVQAGDTVTWKNLDGTAHTSTSGQPGAPDGKWDSSFLNQNQTFAHTFETAGSFPYFCIPHAFSMQGRVVVEGAPQAPSVAITSPANNAVLDAATPVSIVAEGLAPGGSIVMVEFYDGATFLDMDHDSPFSITANLATGAHTLTAKATANSGIIVTSAPVTVTVRAAGTRIDDPYPPIAKSDITVELEPVASGLISPLGLAAPDDQSNRLFVFDQVGAIYVITNGTMLETPLLDLRNRLVPLNASYDERGLLGVAVHPSFAQNPFIYTYTSETNGPMADFMIMSGSANDHQSVIAEWKIDPANPNRIDLASRREILRVDEPQSNHNAGTMHFGPDGMLYVTFGDGGAADDEGPGHSADGNGQDINKILGKVVRIDVDARTSPNGQYGVPADNPFVGKDGLDEIYAIGFRNPYSWSFDRFSGEMYVADVGQNAIEEVDRVFRGGNYGWPIKEGSFYFDPAGTNNGFITSVPVRDVPADLSDPIAEFDHSEGIAIVGGYVYHGAKLPGLIGRYITGDLGRFGSSAGRLFYLDRSELRELRIGTEDRTLNGFIKGFGEDQQGEIYVMVSTNVGPGGTDGRVLKLVAPANDLFTQISATETNFVLSWTGGVGPFLVQEKEGVDGAWETELSTSERTVAAANDDEVGLFRIVDMAGAPAIPFTVYMTGAAERPQPVQTSGTGTGTLSLEGNSLHFDIHYSGLTGPAIMAHIHGRTNAAGAAGVMINLEPYNGGAFGSNGVLSGTVTLTPEQKAAVLAGETYVNIHTDANKSGEIRGQIAAMVFTAHLTGDAERPEPVDSSGAGSGIFLLAGNQLTLNLEYHGLPSAATLSHIHGPASEDAGAGVMVDLQPLNGGAFGTNGTLSGTVTLNPDQLAALVDELTYVNVHTTNHSAGEIRGQLKPNPGAIPLSASLSAAAERPVAVTNSTGQGSGTFALEGNKLSFSIRYAGLTGPASLAHIHGPATAGQAAGVMINLAPFNGGAFGSNGTLTGSVLLTDEQRAAVLEGRTYVNIHTGLNPSGEIRGQILPVAMQVVLAGTSERNSAIHTAGRGRGTLLLVGNALTLNATYEQLSSPAIAAHIHGPATPAEAVGVMVNLQDLNGGTFGASGSFAGTVLLTPEQLAAVADQRTYLNIHTGTNTGGEVRGQIRR